PYSRDKARMERISQGWPAKWTDTTTFGSLPRTAAFRRRDSSWTTSMFPEQGSISTNPTAAPQYRPQFAEATKVLGEVQRPSPGPRSAARQARCKAEVALDAAAACAAPQ